MSCTIRYTLSMILVSFLLTVFHGKVSGQTQKIDSIRQLLYQTPGDNTELLIALCGQYYSLPQDSLSHYIRLGLARTAKKPYDNFYFKSQQCLIFFNEGHPDIAYRYLDSLYRRLPKAASWDRLRMEMLTNMTRALIRNNQNREGIAQAFRLLEYADRLHDTLFALRAYTSLGWAYMELGKFEDAILWLKKGLDYTHDPRILVHSSALFNNLASSYNNIGQLDSAFQHINTALKCSRLQQNLTFEANGLNIRAAMYLKQNKFSEAQADLEAALHTRESIGDLHFIISDMAQLSSFYASTGQMDKGIAIAQKGIGLADKLRNKSKLIFLNEALAQNYEKAGNLAAFAKTLHTIIELKDTLYKENSEAALAELATKYDLQKKENIIIQQESKLIRNRYFIIGAIIALTLALIIIWLVYRNYFHRQQRQMENAIAEAKIQSIKAVQFAEEKERKRIAADLHDNLGSYAAAITSNIRHLREDQKDSNTETIEQLDENAQAIVNQLSDTIWVLKNEQLSVTKLADRFKTWTIRFLKNYPQVTYNYTEDIRLDPDLNPGKIFNLFMMLKECLNNSLRHSGCTNILITFHCDKELIISIEDNGSGFDLNYTISGSGIDSIRDRANSCNMMVRWESIEPHGTRVTLSGTTTN